MKRIRVLTLVDMSPHFEHVEALGAIGRVADRRDGFGRLVDLDAAVGTEMEREEFWRLFNRGARTVMR